MDALKYLLYVAALNSKIELDAIYLMIDVFSI